MSVLEKKVLSRRDFFKAAGSTLAALTLSGCASFAMGGPKKQPNVVFILADDLGYTDLSCMGGDLYETPNIDKLASQSIRFMQAYSSHSTCAPSRIGILTGKYPARVGAIGHGELRGVIGNGLNMPAEEVTLAEALKSNGYKTYHIGKWHVGKEGYRPQDQGFDKVIASNQSCCPGNYFYPFKSKKKGYSIPDLEDYKPGDHLTGCLSDKAVQYIEENENSDRPFFLNLWYHAVHTPIAAKKVKIEKYKAKITPDLHHQNPKYAALIEHLDDGVGRVLEAIDKSGITDNTIVFFFGDNGGEIRRNITSNYPLRDGKVTPYEGGTRVPLFIRWPGVTKAGSVSDERVIGHDFYPTILTMTNSKGDPKHNSNIDGVDLTAVLKNPKAKLGRDELHWLRYPLMVHYKPNGPKKLGPCGTILKGDWKLIEFFELPAPAAQKHHFELFNITKDPYEKTDLADKMPEKVDELKKFMDAWRKKMDAPVYSPDLYANYKKK